MVLTLATEREFPMVTAQFSIDLECLESQVQRILLSSTDPLLLTGDINCNLLSVDTDPCKTKLLEFLDSLSLYQYVCKPTFRSGSLLDVFISNLSTFTTTVQVQQCAYSDHAFIIARLSIPKLRVKPSFIQSRRLHRMCVSDFQMSLCRTDWSPVFSRAGVADQWTAFTDLFLPVLNFHAPSQRIKLHNPSAPPVSDSTLRLMAQRRGLLARSGRTRCMTARDRLRAWDVKFFGSSNLTHKSCGIFVASWGFTHCIGTRLVFHNFFIST